MRRSAAARNSLAYDCNGLQLPHFIVERRILLTSLAESAGQTTQARGSV